MDFEEPKGRTQQFQFGGAESTRPPQFRTMQTGAGRGGYRNTSVLDNLQPSGNGMSAQDKQRSLYGVNRSTLGTSNSTFDKSLWLGTDKSKFVPLYSQNG